MDRAHGRAALWLPGADGLLRCSGDLGQWCLLERMNFGISLAVIECRNKVDLAPIVKENGDKKNWSTNR